MYAFGPWKEDGEPTHTHGENVQTPHRKATGLGIEPETLLLLGHSANHCTTVSIKGNQNTEIQKKEWQVKDHESQIYDNLTKFWSGPFKFKDKPATKRLKKKKNPIQFQ